MVGLTAYMQADYLRARVWAEKALAGARELGDKGLIASCLNVVGGMGLIQGDYDEERTLREESLALYRELGDVNGIAALLMNLGEGARYRGDYRRACDLYKESLGLFRSLGEAYETGVMYAVVNLGQALQHLGDFREARVAFVEALTLASRTHSSLAASAALAGLSGVILASLDLSSHSTANYLERMKRAALLSGLAATLLERSGRQLEPVDRVEFDHNLVIIRERLGEELFNAAWQEGQAMTIEEALELATGQNGYDSRDAPSRTRGQHKRQNAGGLTSREYEIAALIAHGKSNREIAEVLVVTERTVEWHTSNILAKLGFQSRSQIAVWAVEQGLTTPSQ
jgi:DNA-binding CsgD family transcriptional regulator/tetratricopeptide (TPR) repeat protein